MVSATCIIRLLKYPYDICLCSMLLNLTVKVTIRLHCGGSSVRSVNVTSKCAAFMRHNFVATLVKNDGPSQCSTTKQSYRTHSSGPRSEKTLSPEFANNKGASTQSSQCLRYSLFGQFH